MKAKAKHAPLCTALAAALAAFGTAATAQEDEVASLRTPSSEVSAGVGVVDTDNQRFGQYNGLNEKGGYLLLDADVVRRNDQTGTWLKLRGRNLGLDSRELRLEHNRQGDWGYFIDFSQTPRFNPYTVNSGLIGLGSTTQTRNNIAPGTGTDYNFKTERKNWTLGFDKALSRGLDFQVRFRNEEKDGLRQWGQGTFGTGWLFLAEPIDQTTRQIDAVLSYTTERLQLSGGYYGTSFDNQNNRVTVVGGIFPSMALPPDNQAHQLHLAGGYSFTPTTRATFKLAYARLTQNDTFPDVSVTGRTDLGAVVETKQAQLGFTTRPLPRLSLLANLRYEDRHDKTPIFLYLPLAATPTATTDGTNEPRSIKTTAGKVEASYALPAAFKVTGGVDYEEKKRNTFRVVSVSQRETTEETTMRAELRRPVSETITGAVGFAHSERGGSDYLTTIRNNGTLGANLIAPLHIADRDRDQLRLSLNWMPADALSVQFRADEARDDYTSRGGFDLGPRKGRASFYSVDGAYSFSEAWQANAWASRSDNRAEQASCAGIPATGPFVCTGVAPTTGWASNVRNVQDSVGLGLNAKPRGDLDLGAEIVHSRMRDEFELSRIAGTAVIGELPDIPTRITSLKLFAKYALARNSGVRLQYVHDRFKTDDWTWANWTYSDGTQVRQEATQKVNFIGLAYYYQFR